MEIKIDNDFKNLIPPLQDDEIKQLETNILNEGWRDNERILTWNNFIIDGHNRYNICIKNNINYKLKDMQFKDKNEVIIWMIDNQLGRRNLPDYARVELNLKKEDILKPLAKENQKNPFGKKVPQEMEGSALIKAHPSISYGNKDNYVRVSEKIGKLSNVSHNTVEKVKFIRDNADEDIKQKLRSGNKDLSINKVYTDLRKKEQRINILENAKKPQLETNKKYSIIYADPPWSFWGGGNKNQSQHYKTMTLKEIKELPVKELSQDDCILFLWVTFPILKEAFEVIESWGFNYSTCGFNWIKRNKKSDSWFFGLGYWTRANSELCLIATKGHPMRQSNSVSQIIDTPIEEHSKKPNCVMDKIIELMGDLPRIELFARTKTEGWDTWGNEL